MLLLLPLLGPLLVLDVVVLAAGVFADVEPRSSNLPFGTPLSGSLFDIPRRMSPTTLS